MAATLPTKTRRCTNVDALTFYARDRSAKDAAMGARFLAGWHAATGVHGALLVGASSLAPGPAVFYGVTPETLPLYRQCIAEQREHYYIDNGYFNSRYEGGTYYRVTRNAPQHDGVGVSDGVRWRALGLSVAPWKSPSGEGLNVLLVLQSPYWHERHGESASAFVYRLRDEIGRYTWRDVIVRSKSCGTPLEAQLLDAAVVVTHSSNVAVKALLAGIPVVTMGPCAASTLATPLHNIMVPHMPADPTRLRWAEVLADNQWTLDEIERGDCARALNGGL